MFCFRSREIPRALDMPARASLAFAQLSTAAAPDAISRPDDPSPRACEAHLAFQIVQLICPVFGQKARYTASPPRATTPPTLQLASRSRQTFRVAIAQDRN